MFVKWIADYTFSMNLYDDSKNLHHEMSSLFLKVIKIDGLVSSNAATIVNQPYYSLICSDNRWIRFRNHFYTITSSIFTFFFQQSQIRQVHLPCFYLFLFLPYRAHRAWHLANWQEFLDFQKRTFLRKQAYLCYKYAFFFKMKEDFINSNIIQPVFLGFGIVTFILLYFDVVLKINKNSINKNLKERRGTWDNKTRLSPTVINMTCSVYCIGTSFSSSIIIHGNQCNYYMSFGHELLGNHLTTWSKLYDLFACILQMML